jgi:DNA (cytosine-5)-methyltransferase 1
MSARYHKDGSEILIKQKGWRNPRRLTIGEAALLLGFDPRYSEMFGFPEGFPQVVSDTQAYRQFGNAVVPKVVEAVATGIVSAMAEVIEQTGNGCLLKRQSPKPKAVKTAA